MTFAQSLVVLVLAIPLALVFAERLREDVAALIMLVSLGLAQYAGVGVLGPAHHPEAATQAISGFGTPEVITLLSLFIITYSLNKYGVTRWLAKQLLRIGGQSEWRLIGLFATTGAILSLFMNTLAAGALLMPSALDACRRTGIMPSKLLIPIAYGVMLGGAATYLTTANIVVSSLLPLATPPQKPLGIFDFTPTGGVVAIAGLLFLTLYGKRILPDREPPPAKLPPSSSVLATTFQLQERLWEARLADSSPLVHKTVMDAQINERFGITILAVQRKKQMLVDPSPDVMLEANDLLFLIGREERIMQLQSEGMAITLSDTDSIPLQGILLTEVLVPPRSPFEDKTLQELAFRSKIGFTAIALWRGNRSYRTDVAKMKLRPGDSILMMGSPDDLPRLKNLSELVVLETAEDEDTLDRPKVAFTLAITILALVAIALGVPIEIAMLTAAVLLLVARLLTPDEAYSAIKWRAIFLIAGTYSVSLAMLQTELADLIGQRVVHLVEPFGPVGLVAGAYILSAGLTQFMGGQISPLVVGPITISAAIQLNTNPQAIALVTAIAGSISFITPLSHPVNILMMAPANYTFGDFVKSGWLLTIVCFIALMLTVPLFWPL